MQIEHTSSEIGRKLHEIVKDMPGFKCCNAETQTSIASDGTAWHWVKLSFWTNKGMRNVGHLPYKSQQEASESAFSELDIVIGRACRIRNQRERAAA